MRLEAPYLDSTCSAPAWSTLPEGMLTDRIAPPFSTAALVMLHGFARDALVFQIACDTARNRARACRKGSAAQSSCQCAAAQHQADARDEQSRRCRQNTQPKANLGSLDCAFACIFRRGGADAVLGGHVGAVTAADRVADSRSRIGFCAGNGRMRIRQPLTLIACSLVVRACPRGPNCSGHSPGETIAALRQAIARLRPYRVRPGLPLSPLCRRSWFELNRRCRAQLHGPR